jgi:hypothetical protein
VKPEDTTGEHYTDEKTALTELFKFLAKVGLPKPSIIVNSGGGFHIYWTSNKPLLPHEWQPYAEGLRELLVKERIKCDVGLTTCC